MSYRIKYLPNPCKSITHTVCIGGVVNITMVVSLYNDGRPGALQIFDKNSGSTIEGFLEDWAIQFSRLLQSGETLTWLVRKASYNRYEPCGVTDDPNIPFCTSPLDYIVRWIAWKFAVNVPTQPEENLKK